MNYTDGVTESPRSGPLSRLERPVVLHAVVDTVAVAFAASDTQLTRRVRRSSETEVRMRFGEPRERNARSSTTYHNGVMAHALDFDDMSECVRGHLDWQVIRP